MARYYEGLGAVAVLPVDLPCRMDAFGIITRDDRPLSPAVAGPPNGRSQRRSPTAPSMRSSRPPTVGTASGALSPYTRSVVRWWSLSTSVSTRAGAYARPSTSIAGRPRADVEQGSQHGLLQIMALAIGKGCTRRGGLEQP